jgi:hypothetical protein
VHVVPARPGSRRVDVDALPPLYDSVDTDAVSTFLAHAADAGTDGAVEARFPVADYLVRVSADGVAQYRKRGGGGTEEE